VLSVVRTFNIDGSPNRYAYYEVGQAVANLATQATAEGLTVRQITGFDPLKIRRLYRIPPGHESVTMLAVGYAGNPEQLPLTLQKEEEGPRNRKPLSEFVFVSQWGRPAAPQEMSDEAGGDLSPVDRRDGNDSGADSRP
jgi:nitroreductase